MLKLIVVFLAVAGLIIYWLLNNKNMKTYNMFMKRKKKFEESIKDFEATQKYVYQNMAIAINQDEEELCISTMKNGTPNSLVYNFKDTIGSEVMEDGIAVTANSRNSNLHGEIHDGIQTEDVVPGKKVTRIDLKILIDDLCNPSVLANFMFWEINKNSEEYKKLSEDAFRWHGIIDNIVQGKSNEQILSTFS